MPNDKHGVAMKDDILENSPVSVFLKPLWHGIIGFIGNLECLFRRKSSFQRNTANSAGPTTHRLESFRQDSTSANRAFNSYSVILTAGVGTSKNFIFGCILQVTSYMRLRFF